ncbi:MAG: hypothetical protein ABFR47_10050, partial [Verrucomicrobiota bacterium]
MASEAQINANRLNAEKSTGPRTAEGKAAISKNAVKHGLFAAETVINGEDQARFDLRRAVMLDEWQPVGPMETMIAERIVSLAWRLNRAERMQNQVLDEMIEWMGPTPIEYYIRDSAPPYLRDSEEKFTIPEPAKALGRIARNDWASDKVLERLMIYERRIENSMLKMIRMLKKLQIVRRVETEGFADDPPDETAALTNPAAYPAKQTQFTRAMEDVMAYASKGYDNSGWPDTTENKANQSQFEEGTTP